MGCQDYLDQIIFLDRHIVLSEYHVSNSLLGGYHKLDNLE